MSLRRHPVEVETYLNYQGYLRVCLLGAILNRDQAEQLLKDLTEALKPTSGEVK